MSNEIEQLEKSIHELKHNAERAGFWRALAIVSAVVMVAAFIRWLVG